MTLGPLEITLILLIVLIVFGAGRLPALGRGVGEMIRGFKAEVRDNNDS